MVVVVVVAVAVLGAAVIGGGSQILNGQQQPLVLFLQPEKATLGSFTHLLTQGLA